MPGTKLDAQYFGRASWTRRLGCALKDLKSDGRAGPFVGSHVGVIRQLLTDPDAGPRVVINIGAEALLNFLATGCYKNLYEHPVVGGRRREPTPERIQVDKWLSLPGAHRFYFAAVALGGAGVRFYGEYCMVLRPERIPPDTRIFDRDSYDLLQPPLSGRGDDAMQRLAGCLRGTWQADLVDMLLMKMLPRLPSTRHLITSGQVSGLVMTDQEFVEVHLEGPIQPSDIEQVTQLPDEPAMEASIAQRQAGRQAPSAVELLWLKRRREVAESLAMAKVPHGLATQGGRGYQWT